MHSNLQFPHKTPTALFSAVVCLLFSSYRANAISFEQVDTFQDGTVMDWQEGVSPNPPTNVPTGGPAGVGDAFLADDSSGNAGSGGRMVMFNTQQWVGNYNAEGVDRVTANMINLGSTTLQMRIAMRGGPNGTTFASTVAVTLPPNGVWTSVTFDLAASSLTNLGGVDTLDQVLANVTQFRILSSAAPSFTGDIIQATLGVDNVTAIDIAGARLRITAFAKVSNVPQITFTTLAGRVHRVEKKNALSDANWVPISNGSDVSGTGSTVQVADTEPGAGSSLTRFYRVELLPE